MPDTDQLAVLRRMRNEGRISDEEYQDLAQGYAPAQQGTEAIVEPADPIHEAPGEDGPSVLVTPADEPVPDGEAPDHTEASTFLPMPSLREGISPTYVTTLALAGVFLVVASSLGLLSWVITITVIGLLATTLIEGWRKITLIGAAAVAVIMAIGLVMSLGGSPEPVQAAPGTLPPQDPHPPVAGSLGIYMDQITDAWNEVAAPPRIVKGLTRHNETGEYDTFIYRFGAWGRVAGAYDPADEVLYALLVTGQMSAEDTDQLYIHLCHLAAPYSQECIDSYHAQGLEGGVLDDFADTHHEAEWMLDDQTWRLEIEQNVLTIRVFGEDAA